MQKLLSNISRLGILILMHTHLQAQLTVTDSLEQQLQSGKNTGVERIDILLNLSDLYMSRNPDKSMLYAREAVKESRQTGEKEWIGKSYRTLGNCYADHANYDSSALYLNMARAYIPEDAMTRFFLGQNEWFNGDYESSILYYDTAAVLARKLLDIKTLAIIYYSYAEYHRYMHHDSLAEKYISASLYILERSVLYRDLAVAYNIQAEIFRKEGNYTKAMESYSKTARIAYQILDSNRIGFCMSRMGYIYYMQDDFTKAELYLVKSLEIAEKVKSRHLRLSILKTLTDLYSNLVDEKKCRYYAGLTTKAALEMEDPTGEPAAYVSLSNLYYRTGQTDSAWMYAEKAYNIASINEDYLNMLNAILNKIPIEFENNHYTSVVTLTGEGIELANITETMEHLVDLYKYRYLSYEKMGKNAEAFLAYQQFSIYEDSLRNDEVDFGMEKNELELNYLNKHLSDTLAYIETVQKARQETLLQTQRSEFFVATGIILIALLMVLLFTIWITSLKRKKLNISLAESNLDKELLLKEIHHRVKNSLQIVSSLLNLQKNDLEKKDVLSVINDSQARINNIAIVHELLYQTSSFRKINLPEYFEKLITHILITYNTEGKKIEIRKNIEALEVDLDKSVPLALIINEVITNCVKYAFTQQEKGMIEISCMKKSGRIWLGIHDNGKGIREELLKNNQSIGLSLIRGFARQLGGEAEWKNENGCFFVFSFPYNH